MDRALDSAQIVYARTGLGLGSGSVFQLLRLSEGLGGGVTGCLGLGLHALDLGLGGLRLTAELLVLITHLPDFIAQAEDVFVFLTQTSQFFAGSLRLRLFGVSLRSAELLEFLRSRAQLVQFGSLLLVGVVQKAGGNRQGHDKQPG